MADVDQDQRTEPATGKHRSEALARGEFARCPDIQVVFVLTAALAVVLFKGTDVAEEMRDYAYRIFRSLGESHQTSEALIGQTRGALATFAHAVMPLLIVSGIAAILAGGLQSGFRLTPQVLGFKLEKLNFVNGLKGLFSIHSLMTLPFDLLKLTGISLALWIAVRKVLKDPLFYTPMEVAHLARFLHHATLIFLGWVCGALAIIAIANYAYEHRQTEKKLRMTKQEVKDEMRQAEGDPMIKGHRRRLARRLLQRQMLEAVPTADVVVTNPTHYAVALKYERGIDAAPVVLAKGEDRFAQRIKAIAREHGVPVIENKMVARLLCTIGEVGEAIPGQLYQAVAEILAFVYRTHRYYFYTLKTRRAAAAATR